MSVLTREERSSSTNGNKWVRVLTLVETSKSSERRLNNPSLLRRLLLQNHHHHRSHLQLNLPNRNGKLTNLLDRLLQTSSLLQLLPPLPYSLQRSLLTTTLVKRSVVPSTLCCASRLMNIVTWRIMEFGVGKSTSNSGGPRSIGRRSRRVSISLRTRLVLS